MYPSLFFHDHYHCYSYPLSLSLSLSCSTLFRYCCWCCGKQKSLNFSSCLHTPRRYSYNDSYVATTTRSSSLSFRFNFLDSQPPLLYNFFGNMLPVCTSVQTRNVLGCTALSMFPTGDALHVPPSNDNYDNDDEGVLKT